MAPMLWIKALHIVFVASWFAGLFYLPRLFVNLASVPADSHAERERLLMMARKLYRFSSLLMVPAIGLGLWLWWLLAGQHGISGGWLHAKLALVLAMSAMHGMFVHYVRDFADDRNRRTQRFYRIINEVPTLLMIGIVILVVVKPF